MSTKQHEFEPGEQAKYQGALLVAACAAQQKFPSELAKDACLPRLPQHAVMKLISDLVFQGFLQPTTKNKGYYAPYAITPIGRAMAQKFVAHTRKAREQGAARKAGA